MGKCPAFSLPKTAGLWPGSARLLPAAAVTGEPRIPHEARGGSSHPLALALDLGSCSPHVQSLQARQSWEPSSHTTIPRDHCAPGANSDGWAARACCQETGLQAPPSSSSPACFSPASIPLFCRLDHPKWQKGLTEGLDASKLANMQQLIPRLLKDAERNLWTLLRLRYFFKRSNKSSRNRSSKSSKQPRL